MTLDFIDDACDSLDEDGRPYILIVGEDDGSLLFSNISEENIELLEEWLKDGHWNEMLRQHIDQLRKV